MTVLCIATMPLSVFATTLCPDGSRVEDGNMCVRTPNGSFVGGDMNKQYNPVTRCPDGTYVSGTSCELQPDGSFR